MREGCPVNLTEIIESPASDAPQSTVDATVRLRHWLRLTEAEIPIWQMFFSNGKDAVKRPSAQIVSDDFAVMDKSLSIT